MKVLLMAASGKRERIRWITVAAGVRLGASHGRENLRVRMLQRNVEIRNELGASLGQKVH